MNFSWSKTQNKLYEEILSYSQKYLNRSVGKREQAHQFCQKSWELCGEAGLLALCVPEQYGGKGYDVLTTAYITEAFGEGCEDTGLVFAVGAHLFACLMPIVHYGTKAQKAKFLPKLAKGNWIAANAITEKNSGSDVFHMQATAKKQGKEYVLNGTKSYVTNGPIADVFIVYAMTNPAHGYFGITGFIIEKNTPGLTITKAFKKMGLSTTQGGQIILDHCKVPEKNRLGVEGQGAKIFSQSMQWERTCLFAGFLGTTNRLFQKCLIYAKTRHQSGQPIGKFQSLSHSIADMHIKIESARLLLYQACWLMDQGKDASKEVSMGKIAISEAFVQVSLKAIQIHGGNGYNQDYGIERYLRNAMGTKIFSGTSEIQRDLIAKRLGL